MPPATSPEPRRAALCPGCGAPATAAYRPFCGKGCRDRDLLEWLTDGYRIPGGAGEEDEDAAPVALDSRSTRRL